MCHKAIHKTLPLSKYYSCSSIRLMRIPVSVTARRGLSFSTYLSLIQLFS